MRKSVPGTCDRVAEPVIGRLRGAVAEVQPALPTGEVGLVNELEVEVGGHERVGSSFEHEGCDAVGLEGRIASHVQIVRPVVRGPEVAVLQAPSWSRSTSGPGGALLLSRRGMGATLRLRLEHQVRGCLLLATPTISSRRGSRAEMGGSAVVARLRRLSGGSARLVGPRRSSVG